MFLREVATTSYEPASTVQSRREGLPCSWLFPSQIPHSLSAPVRPVWPRTLPAIRAHLPVTSQRPSTQRTPSYLHRGQEPVGLVAACAHGGLGEGALCGQAWPVAEDPLGSGSQHSDGLKKRHHTQQPQRQEDPTTWESEATDMKKPISNPIYYLRKIRNKNCLYFNNLHTVRLTFLCAQSCEF